MKLKELLIQGLKKRKATKIHLLDLLEKPCAAEHMYRLKSTPSESYFREGEVLRPLVEKEFLKTLRKYFKGAYSERFEAIEEPILFGKYVYVDVLGAMDGSLVVPIYTNGTPSPSAMMHLAARVAGIAYGGEHHEAYLLLVCREKADFSLYRIFKPFGPPTSEFDEVKDDCLYLEGIMEGKVGADGIGSECIVCKFSESCTVAEKFEAKPYSFPGGSSTYGSDQTRELSQVSTYLYNLKYQDDGRNTGKLSPSEMSISKCDLRMAYKLMKKPREASIPASLRKIFDIGHAVHEVIQGILHKESDEFLSEQKASVAGTSIEGSCDGNLNGEGLEIKSIGSKGFKKLRSPKTDHKKQGAIYAMGLGLKEMLYVYYNKKNGELAFYTEHHKPQERSEAVVRALEIEDAVRRGELPKAAPGWGCRTCAYAWFCEHAPKKVF